MAPRTFLFVPANRPRMFAHAEASAADRIVLDLEDAVPVAEKAAARAALVEGVAAFSTPETRVFLRLNGDPEERDADFAVAGALPLAGFVIPKVNAPEDVQHVNHWLDWIPNTELARRVTLVALIESPAGVLSAPAFVTERVPRLSALAFGAEDFREAMGITDTGSGPLLDAARASIAMAAAAAGLLAVDSPVFDLRDPDRLLEETRRARALGFRAKFAIHPAQLAAIHEGLTPSPVERAWAARVLGAYEAAAREGAGSVEVDGRMIDLATLKRARAILGDADDHQLNAGG